MTPEETAWLAGLLEGEGCFAMGSGVQVIVSMTDEDIVLRAATLMGATAVTCRTRTNPAHKPLFTARAYGTEAERVMRAIRPLLGTRRGTKVDELLAARALQFQPVPVTCPECGTDFIRPPCGRGLGSPRKYCDLKCKHLAQTARKRAARRRERTSA